MEAYTQLFFIGIILSLLACMGVLSIRLGCYKRQLRHMLSELQMAVQDETNLLFTCAVHVGQAEETICVLNQLMEKNRHIKEQLLRENKNYRESITSISHDIRTPLTSAKGYMQLIRAEQVAKDKRYAYAKIVEQRLDTLAGMLDQLFLYTRIEAGEFPLTMEPLNAGNLFAETISLFYSDFCKKGSEPDVQIAQTPCLIQADRQAFVRIVENLIKNALVHGTGCYGMSLLPKDAYAIIRIANQTDSIEASDIDFIFDRFYTTDVSRSRKTTGLGLAIVKELAGQMGGKADAYLDGSIFSVEVRFPLLES